MNHGSLLLLLLRPPSPIMCSPLAPWQSFFIPLHHFESFAAVAAVVCRLIKPSVAPMYKISISPSSPWSFAYVRNGQSQELSTITYYRSSNHKVKWTEKEEISLPPPPIHSLVVMRVRSSESLSPRAGRGETEKRRSRRNGFAFNMIVRFIQVKTI